MNMLEFEQMCRDASLALGLHDTGALGQGSTVVFEGVPLQTAYRDGRDSFLVMAELGPPGAGNTLAVYENMLTLQLLTWNQPGVRFGFHPARRTLQLCVDARCGARAAGDWLALLLRSVAQQALLWRETLLPGDAGVSEGAVDQMEARLTAFMAQEARALQEESA
jgi:hypothetical protein